MLAILSLVMRRSGLLLSASTLPLLLAMDVPAAAAAVAAASLDGLYELIRLILVAEYLPLRGL